MSEKVQVKNRVPVEKPDTTTLIKTDHPNVSKQLLEPGGNVLLAKVLLEQNADDPVEKGPFIPLMDNSPRTGRNASVMKAKLREQESRHSLEIVRLRREYEVKECEVREEIAQLRRSISDLQDKLETEIAMRQDAERRDAQTSKDLLVISIKCGEMQGRLDESQGALVEARGYIETLRTLHEERLAGMRKDFVDIEERHHEAQQEQERKIRNLEEQLREARTGFDKTLMEKLAEWTNKEEEFVNNLKQSEEDREKMSQEKVDLASELEKVKAQLKETEQSRNALQSEMDELREYQKMESTQVQQDHDNRQRELREEMDAIRKECGRLEEELVAMKSLKDEVVAEKETNVKKYEESIRMLKETLTVLDEQNKDLISELKLIQEKCEEKQTVSATLAAQVNSLLAERNEAQTERQNLLDEKCRLESELAAKMQSLDELKSEQDSKISSLQDELASTRETSAKELNEKATLVGNLETIIDNLRQELEQSLKEKSYTIDSLTKQLEEEQSVAVLKLDEFNRMKESVQGYSKQLQEINVKYEGSRQQITKLNMEMSRLINEIVNIKEENIDLKSGLNEALQKGEFYKDRNHALTEQLAQIQRDKTEKEAELMADIKEKISLIEYLQNQVTANTPCGSEKKKRRFFQIKSTPISPSKSEAQSTANADANAEDSI